MAELKRQLITLALYAFLILLGISFIVGGRKGAANVVGRIVPWAARTIRAAVCLLILTFVNTAGLILRLATDPVHAGDHFARYVERMTDSLLGAYRGVFG
jgi:hypothetical protein